MQLVLDSSIRLACRRLLSGLVGMLLLLLPVSVQAAPPVLGALNFNPAVPVEGEVTSFTVVATDPEGQTMTYAWDFGDGGAATGATPGYAFGPEGNYVVTVTVTDSSGESAVASAAVSVANGPPEIQSIGGDLSGETAALLTFQAVASDPGNDPLTYSWDWGDGSSPDSGLGLDSASHSYASSDDYTLTLVVTDDAGGAVQDTALVTVNALPVIESLSAGSTSSIEGDVTSFAVVASDPDDHGIGFSWDFGDNSPPIFTDTPSHLFADDGNYTVTVTVTDTLGASSSDSLVFPVVNAPPVLIGLVGDSSGAMGESLAFSGSALDPAGVADTLTWSWDWGEGGAPTVGIDLSDSSHAWASVGTFTMTLTVTDEDGGSFVQGMVVSISNPGPTLSAVSGAATVDEGESAQWSVAAVDAAGNPITLSWSWGDGSADSSALDLLSPAHTYADDGVYTITVTGVDVSGGTATSSFVVTVVNLPPTLIANPGLTAIEGSSYIVLLSSTDPGADSPSYLVVQAPTGTLYDAGTASVVWNPSLAQALAGPALFEVQVDDGDGGTDSLSWSVVATWVDDDLDGMADSWELGFGLDPTVDDGLGDPDGDGVSNLDEWLDQTDPVVSNGPGKPEPLSPLAGVAVTQSAPELVVYNALDPDGDTLSYEFEVYQDETLALLLYSGHEAEGSSGTTAHTTASGLTENAVLYWRARAEDAGAVGPWSKLSGFFMDAVNDPPATPQPLYPVETTVPGPLPTFQVAEIFDPEGDALQVTVYLYGDEVGLVATFDGSLSAAGDGTWVFSLPGPLDEDRRYQWSVSATDVRGATSLSSALVWFEVDANNASPQPPQLLAPLDEVTSQTPTLQASAGSDPDGDRVVVRFQVDSQHDFASLHGQYLGTTEVDGEGLAETAVVQALPENALAWVRARTEDERGAASEWVSSSFFVNSLEEAPNLVQVVAPGDGEAVAGTEIEVRWAPTLDVDGDELTYQLKITRSGAEAEEIVWEQGGLVILPADDGVSEGLVIVDTEVLGGGYEVQARAVDDTGLEGAWGPANSFVILSIPGAGIDLDDFGSGCGCSAWAGSSRPSSCLLAFLVGMVLLRRRRRHS